MKKTIFLTSILLVMCSLLSTLKADDKFKIAEKSKYPSFSQNKINEFIITTKDTVFFRGRILDFNDSLLVLWRLNEPINEKNIYKFANRFHVSEIQRISLLKKNKKDSWFKGAIFGCALGSQIVFKNSDSHEDNILIAVLSPFIITLSALSGALMGAIIDSESSYGNKWLINGNINKFQAIKEVLMKNSMLPELPDEMLNSFAKPLHSPGKEMVTPELKKHLKRLAPKKNLHKSHRNHIVHLSINSCFSYTDLSKETIRAFVESGFSECNPENGLHQSQQYPIVQDRKKVSTFGLEIDLSSHIRLGLSMTKNSSTITGCGKLEESEYLAVTTTNIFLEYVGTKILKDRIEFSIGGG